MVRNHYGRYVDSENPIVGVVLNTEPEHLLEDAFHGIDIDYAEFVADCEANGIDPLDEDWETGALLIGYSEITDCPELVKLARSNPWVVEAGNAVFTPNPDAEYFAIVGEVYTQVLWSRFVQRAPLCSPCYPGQGDLDTAALEGQGFLVYTLPPAVWGERKSFRRISQFCPTRGEVCYA